MPFANAHQNSNPETNETGNIPTASFCVVAIARDETPFLDEWLAYHRLLGVEHFFIYDDDPHRPLREFLKPYESWVTVIDWYGKSKEFAGKDRQLRAYGHALRENAARYEWVAFIDIDEFIVLRQHPDLPTFLSGFGGCSQISLHWHLFGHCGFFDDPPGLVTTHLTKRKANPSRMFKSIVKTSAIAGIANPYECELHPGHVHVDPNKVAFDAALYPAKTQIAHINHYICRSFTRWMKRPERGSVVDDVLDRSAGTDWMHRKDGCLRQFVQFVAAQGNEIFDDFLIQYQTPIETFLETLGISELRKPIPSAPPIIPATSTQRVPSNSIAVYTAIAGGYDALKEQKERRDVAFVAYLETPLASETWQVRVLERSSDDPNRDAKIYKILSHRYFPDKPYTLWIDGSVILNFPAHRIIEAYLSDFDLVVHKHPARDCIFAEAAICCQRGMDDCAIIEAQMARYRREAYPSSAGLWENTVLLRRNNYRVEAFNELWWEEIQRGSRRDQLSAPYVARRVGLRVGYFPGSLRSYRPDYNGIFEVLPHKLARP